MIPSNLKSDLNKTSVILLIVLILLAITYRVHIGKIKTDCYRQIAQTQAALDEKIISLRSEERKNLEEKYRADQVSYQALAKRAELERAKMAQLEKDLTSCQSQKK